jgi:hypothetical protein
VAGGATALPEEERPGEGRSKQWLVDVKVGVKACA